MIQPIPMVTAGFVPPIRSNTTSFVYTSVSIAPILVLFSHVSHGRTRTWLHANLPEDGWITPAHHAIH